jgi:hypothetical protein
MRIGTSRCWPRLDHGRVSREHSCLARACQESNGPGR